MEVLDKGSVHFSKRLSLGSEKNLWESDREWVLDKETKEDEFPERSHPRTQGVQAWLGGLPVHARRSLHPWAGTGSDTPFPTHTPAGFWDTATDPLGWGWGLSMASLLLLTHGRPQQWAEIPWWKPIFLTFLPALRFSREFLGKVFLSSKLQRDDGSKVPKWGGKADCKVLRLPSSSPRDH